MQPATAVAVLLCGRATGKTTAMFDPSRDRVIVFIERVERVTHVDVNCLPQFEFPDISQPRRQCHHGPFDYESIRRARKKGRR